MEDIFVDCFKPRITVEEKLELMRQKEKQIDALGYEKDLIEGDIVYQMRTAWSYNSAYNIICGLVPDFWEDITGKYEERKDDEKYLKDINWVLEIVKRKLRLPAEITVMQSFRYIEAILLYGAGFGYKPCEVDLIFELHCFGYKPIKIQIQIPIYENVNIKDYKYELGGIEILYEEKEGIWDFACADLEYEKLADKFQEWMSEKLRYILVKEEENKQGD